MATSSPEIATLVIKLFRTCAGKRKKDKTWILLRLHLGKSRCMQHNPGTLSNRAGSERPTQKKKEKRILNGILEVFKNNYMD